MNKLALCIATAILAVTACTEPPGDDGGGTTDALGDRADGDFTPDGVDDEASRSTRTSRKVTASSPIWVATTPDTACACSA